MSNSNYLTNALSLHQCVILMQIAVIINELNNLPLAVASPIIISSYHIPSQGSIYSIPQEGQSVTFNCNKTGQRRALFWILPNGTRIDVVDSATDSSSGPIFALATHQDGSNATFGLNVSHSQLVIPEVHKGMDGRYVCVMEDAQQRVFFIPYVISSINFSQSLMVSLSVAVCFAIACLLVLIFDRYCKSLLSVKICCSNGGGDNYDRNRNLSSDQLSISDHTSPIQQRKQQRFAMNHMNFVVDDEISTKMDSSSRCSTDSNNHNSASMKSVKDTDTYNSGNNSDDNDKDRHVSNSITNSTVLSHELTIPVSDSIHL